MKNVFIVCLAVFFALSLTSCDDGGSGGGGSNSGFPASFEDYLEFDHFLVIATDCVDDLDVYCISFVEPMDFELRFGDNEIEMGEWIDEDFADIEECKICGANDIEFEDLNMNEQGEFDYYVELNNRVYRGELQLLPLFDEVTCDEFDINEDWNVEWEIGIAPRIYIIEAYFEFSYGDVWEYIKEMWQIDGNETRFTIPQSSYNDYADCDDYYCDIFLEAINYVNHDKFMIFTETYCYPSDYCWDQKSGLNKFREKVAFQNKFRRF